MSDTADLVPPDPDGVESVWDADAWVPRVPDVVDLVVEAAALEAVFAAQRLVRVDGMRRELLAEATGRGAGVSEIVERSIRLELAAAMRVTEYAAGRMIAHADALVQRYPAALDSLGGGRITPKHAEVLVDEVDRLDPSLRDDVAARAVALAEAEPVGTFRRALKTLVDRVQAATLEERCESAVQNRRVIVESGDDGMGVLLLFAPEVELHAIFGRVTAIGKTIAGAEGETRILDQARADVLCDLLIDGSTERTPAQARGIRATVVVTVPALSLLDDEAAHRADPAVVEGIGPIPLSRARELCGGDTRWMRVLTHPETGMILSVGRDHYRPPPALRRLVKWRADRCMAPGCAIPASRCEIDHQIRWIDGGDTSLDNSAPFCRGHHIVKDNTDWIVRQIPDSGGAIEWISPTGRQYVVRPERHVPTFTVTPGTDAAPEHEPAAPF